MSIQNQVKSTLINHLTEVVATVTSADYESRTSIANELCERFSLLDYRGYPQTASCLKALRELESAGYLFLPAPRSRQPAKPGVRRTHEAVPQPVGVPGRADEVGDLQIIPVESDRDMRLWNELMIREHPLGDCRLVGRQMRYLVRSEHGILGAAGFGAGALQLRARDDWIGWGREIRQQHLDRIVCMNRFLVRPGTDCRNLASRMLGMICRRFPRDFKERYGYSPWLLESFIDSDLYRGTCYRAANWQRVGKSRGRGRQDRNNQRGKSEKDVYIYVLNKKFRDIIGIPEPKPYAPIDVRECGIGENWAEEEFHGAPLGDKRLEKRLISIAQEKSKAPTKPFTEVARGDRAAIAGYYRFIDAPAGSEIDMDAILQPHRDRTLCRMNNSGDVLCLHDTTDLNLDNLNVCEGLGVIGSNQTKTKTRGLRLHSSLAVDTESGIPLGVLHQNCYAPEKRPAAKRNKDQRYVPIEHKEINRWITSLNACTELTGQLDSGTSTVHVMDREADFFELFSAWRHRGRDHLIVRAKHDRSIGNGLSLFQGIRETEPVGEIAVEVRRRSGRRKQGRRAAQSPRAARTAPVEIRTMPVLIRPPKHGLSSKKEPVQCWLLHAWEREVPEDGSEPIEWFLICTFPVETLETAEYAVSSYAKRWRIEDWHRTLKSCCRAQDSAVESAEQQMRLLAINMVLAWRVMLLMHLGRQLPDLPPELLFSDIEIEVLNKCAPSLPGPSSPKSLGDYWF